MLSVSHQQINTLCSSLPVPTPGPDSLTSDNVSNFDAISLPADLHLRDEFISLGKNGKTF